MIDGNVGALGDDDSIFIVISWFFFYGLFIYFFIKKLKEELITVSKDHVIYCIPLPD